MLQYPNKYSFKGLNDIGLMSLVVLAVGLSSKFLKSAGYMHKLLSL